MPLNFIRVPSREAPTDFPLPEPYAARYAEGAPGDITGPFIEGRSTGALVHGALAVTNRTGRTTGGGVASQVEIQRQGVFGAALVDWFEFERLGGPCDLELVIYDRDDATEYYVAGSSPYHEFPHLIEPTSYGEAEVDFARGRTSIGQINLSVLDKRRVTADQRTGRFTHKLADAEGRPIVIGRRVQVRRFTEGGWKVVVHGIVMDLKMDKSFVAFQIIIRDFRELERKASAFNGGGTSTVFPRGVLNGWGRKEDGTFIVPPSTRTDRAWHATYRVSNDHPGLSWFDLDSKSSSFPAKQILTDRMIEAAEASFDRELGYEIQPKVAVLWRREGTNDPWNELRNIAVYEGEFRFSFWRRKRMRVALFHAAGDTSYDGRKVGKLLDLRIYKPQGPNGAPPVLPAHGQRVEVIVVYIGPPSEDYPFHWEGTAGELLMLLYDGAFSESPRFHLGYDADALAAFTQPVRLRLTEPIKDARKWAEDNLWTPLGAAPAWNEAGDIYPVFSALPASADELIALDADVVEPEVGWSHLGSRAVNVLRFTYPRAVYLTDDEDPFGEEAGGDGVYIRDVTAVFEAEDSVYDLEEKAVEIETEAFVALGDSNGEALGGNAELEVGWMLASARHQELFARYRYGAQVIAATCRRSLTHMLKVGDWIRQRIPWNPDYNTGLRGPDRIAQITAIKDESCGWRSITAEDVVARISEDGGGVVLPPPVEVEP